MHLFISKVQIILLCFIYSNISEAGQYILFFQSKHQCFRQICEDYFSMSENNNKFDDDGDYSIIRMHHILAH